MTFWKGTHDWRMDVRSGNGVSFLQFINHHHLGKKGFRCQQDKVIMTGCPDEMEDVYDS